MRPELFTLAEVLRAQGYETVAFASATTTRSINTGLQKGFDRYSDSLVTWSELLGRDEFQHLIFFYLAGFAQNTQIPGEVVTQRAIRWLDRRSGRPFFAWLHYFDPHAPFGSPPPFRDMYKGKVADGGPLATERERYAEDITYMDFHLGRFLAVLRDKNLYDDTIVIVTSDHGEAFGEQHAHITETGHGHYLSDVTQRVPLIIKPAGNRAAARRIAEQVELTDLAPTILRLLNIDAPASFCGRPLAGLLHDRSVPPAGRDAHSFTTVHVEQANGDALYLQELSVRTERWKYITRPRLGEAELYDLHEDPLERENVIDTHPAIAQALHARLVRFWDPHDAKQDPRAGLAPLLVRQLQALGYLEAVDEE